MEECRCKWCGFQMEISEVEVAPDGSAFWCPDCDKLTYFKEGNDKRRILLMLENKENCGKVDESIRKKCACLKKRLSPLRYPGGKSKVIDQIFCSLQGEKLETFAEVFAGGASLGLSLLYAGKIKRLILNDMNPWVYNFWNTVLYEAESLIKKINDISPTLSDFWAAKEKICDSQMALLRKDEISVEDAYDFLLLNRTSFGGIIGANPIAGKSCTNEEFLQRWNPTALCQRILRLSHMSDLIEVYCENAATPY